MRRGIMPMATMTRCDAPGPTVLLQPGHKKNKRTKEEANWSIRKRFRP